MLLQTVKAIIQSIKQIVETESIRYLPQTHIYMPAHFHGKNGNESLKIYQSGNQKPQIEERTIQWQHEKGQQQNKKQRTTENQRSRNKNCTKTRGEL